MTLEELSKAQRELLCAAPTTCADHYRPAKKLIEMGYAEFREGRYGNYFVLTESGEALRALSISRTTGEG